MNRFAATLATAIAIVSVLHGTGSAADPARPATAPKARVRTSAELNVITPKGAESAAQKANASAPRLRQQTGNWWTSIGGLVAVVSMILMLAKVLRKHVPAAQGLLPSAALQILGKRHLENRHAIHYVRCGSRILIVGSSQQGLNTLAEITDPVEVDYLTGLCQPSRATSTGANFGQLFKRFRASEDEVAAEPEEDFASQRLKDRLEESIGLDLAAHTAEGRVREVMHG